MRRPRTEHIDGARRRPQRTRIFIGCEGASEQGYAALLGSLLDAHGLSVHLEAVILNPGAGDPHELVKRAVVGATRLAKLRGSHASRFLLLDSDRHDGRSDVGRQTVSLAREHDINLIWQEPCHEALLLRHLRGCSELRPSTTAHSQAAIERHWPAYSKPMSSRALGLKIDETAILRAARVEPGLRVLLRSVGLLNRTGSETGKNT